MEYKFNRMEKLHGLILERKTGSPKELAEKLGVNRTTLYVLIDEISTLATPVSYSRKYETFYYKESIDLKSSLKVNKHKLI